MVHFKIIKGRIYGYQGDKYMGAVGKVDEVDDNKLNYFRRKFGGKL